MIQGDQPAFALPCARFAGCCTIYDQRPEACRGFRCALLRRLDDREIGLDAALDIVTEARRLVSDAMPGAPATELAVEFRKQRQEPGPSTSNPQRLKFIALGLYLDRHFVLPRDGNFYSVQPVAGSVT